METGVKVASWSKLGWIQTDDIHSFNFQCMSQLYGFNVILGIKMTDFSIQQKVLVLGEVLNIITIFLYIAKDRSFGRGR